MDTSEDGATRSNLQSKLHYITGLIKNSQLREARSLLIQLVKENPRSELSWLLLSQVVPETDVKIHCLEQALSINPANKSAWETLNQILASKNKVNLVGARINDEAKPFTDGEVESNLDGYLATKIISPIDKPTIPVETQSGSQAGTQPDRIEESQALNSEKSQDWQPSPLDHQNSPAQLMGAEPPPQPVEPTRPGSHVKKITPKSASKRMRKFGCSFGLVVLAIFLIGFIAIAVIYST